METEGLPLFDGATFDPFWDGPRLGAQLQRVLQIMLVGDWLTLEEIKDRTRGPDRPWGDPITSISSRLRDLRKHRFGRLPVESRRRGQAASGLWEYRLFWERLRRR